MTTARDISSRPPSPGDGLYPSTELLGDPAAPPGTRFTRRDAVIVWAALITGFWWALYKLAAW